MHTRSAVMLVILWAAAAYAAVPSNSPPAGQILSHADAPTARLREVVDKLLATGDNVPIRRHIHLVWTLVDRLHGEGRDEEAINYIRRGLQSHGGAVAEFDAHLAKMRTADKPWDTEELLETLEKTLVPPKNVRCHLLGVTGKDCDADDSNFLFGLARDDSHHGVISYCRFTAAFHEDDPLRARAVERLLKQSLSSLGFMWGVPRCTDPTCARAYPNSLAEHDADSPRLCSECRERCERFIGRPLPGTDESGVKD